MVAGSYMQGFSRLKIWLFLALKNLAGLIF